MGREDNIICFENTMYMCETDPQLKSSVAASLAGQYFLGEKTPLALKAVSRGKPADVRVSRRRSFEAASAYRGKRVCVLNFASSKNPGGGVVRGASAQEECLCRISTLYPCLADSSMVRAFYEPHRTMFSDTLYNDDLIFTPAVTVFKSDTSAPETLPANERFSVDIVTCAAPNLGSYTRLGNDRLEALHIKRGERIFVTAANEGADVLILGAFGCGAFGNPPQVVASAMKKLTDKYAEYFETIEYAVYCSPRSSANHDAFAKVF